MKLFIIFAIALCASAAEVKEKKTSEEPADINKDKRQTQEDYISGQILYRVPRKQQAAPVQEPQEDDTRSSRSEAEQYRPGQVFSLNAQELLEFQQERKAPLSSSQLLQQIYGQQEQKSSPQQQQQQFYFVEPQTARQVAYQPSHAVIARPHYSSDGGEASVGAALSVSDSGASSTLSFDQELLALLEHQARTVDVRGQGYTQQIQQTSSQNAPQYQQVDRYITKPSKKPTKLRPKAQPSPPTPPTPALLPAGAPQQYLIETTNVQQQQQLQQQQQQQLQQQQAQIQYRPASQPQRPAQALRYVSIPASQPIQQTYERPEQQGLKVVPAPKLQPQPQRQQVTYRLIPQYQQPEASPKQYRILEPQRPQVIRPEQRGPLSSAERPITYLKRYPELEKMRAVKIYEPTIAEAPASEQYYLRSLYRQNEQSQPQAQPQTQQQPQLIRYETLPARPDVDPPRAGDSVKAPHSAIYVSKNLAPKKPRLQPARQEQNIKIEQPSREQVRAEQARVDQARAEQAQREQAQREQAEREQAQREQIHREQAQREQAERDQAHREQAQREQAQREQAQRDQAQREQAQRQEQSSSLEQINLEQHGHSLDDPRVQLPPPKNNKAYTPEEFAALVAAGYAVTPVPVSSLSLESAQSRSSEELVPLPVPQLKRRPVYRRPQYLPLRGDDAP